MSDIQFMQRALDLASRATGKTSPNPLVGAVIVKSGKIIAEGYHKKAGTAHAEAVALKKAGVKAKDATLYVSLEPCCHTNKLTPPCTRAIIKSGIKRVVAAMRDPNPMVSGKGIKELRKAGIACTTGILRAEAEKLNEAFIKHVTSKIPFVTLKIAQSIDGKIATSKGESKWITGGKARTRVHQLRNEVDAILVGIGTVKADNPSLDCRVRGGSNPRRIIVDSNLTIPLSSKVLSFNDGKTIIATTRNANKIKLDSLIKRGCTVLKVKDKAGKVDLNALMQKLGRMDVMSLLIEGGSSITYSALSSSIVDKVMFFIAPKIIGGIDSIPSVGGKSPVHLKNALNIKKLHTSSYGKDILIEGYLQG